MINCLFRSCGDFRFFCHHFVSRNILLMGSRAVDAAPNSSQSTTFLSVTFQER